MILHYQCQQCKGDFYVDEGKMPYNSSTAKDGKEFKEIYCFCPYCKSEDPVCLDFNGCLPIPNKIVLREQMDKFITWGFIQRLDEYRPELIKYKQEIKNNP